MRKLLLVAAIITLSGVHSGAAEKSVSSRQKATFAAGCFWCIQPPFDKAPGVVKTTVGYTGGTETQPTYKQVSAGKTSHAEAIEVVYDPAKISYEKILDVFWRHIDPTTQDRQFPDWGRQYRTAIYIHSEAQRAAALASKEQLEKSGRFDAPIVTQIEDASVFWPAEGYHQKYYVKSLEAYHQYHDHSGRKEYFQRVWGK